MPDPTAKTTVTVTLRLTPAEAATLYDYLGTHCRPTDNVGMRARVCDLRHRLRSALADLGVFAR